jgi:immune inhibitor A
MSLMQTARPVRAIFALLLFAALLLAGCQGITTIPQSSVVEAPTASAEPSAATSTPEAPASATAQSETAEPSNSPSDATPGANPTPSAPASASTPETTTDAGLATLESLSQNLMPRRDQVKLAFEFGRTQSEQRTARTEPLDVKVGDKEVFNVTNVATNRNYTITATLVLALEHVLVYVEDGVELDLQDLEASARQFNDEIYPRNRELFGSEWSPGVDGDPRLTILNARIEGAGGYFSGSDEVPRSVNRFSNEREMFYINTDDRVPGTDSYGDVLAHEFQHMIQWNESERPTTWTNEGLSQLAEELNGFEESVISVAPSYLADPDLQLTTWADNPQEAIPHYGASYLFMTYFYEQYGKDLDLKTLIREGAGERLELFAETARAQNPEIKDFGDLYADWSIANLINNRRYGQGRYAYGQLPSTVSPEQLPNNGEEETVAQFGSDFYEIPQAENERVLRFDGSDTIGVVTATPEGSAMWWSNRGDSGHSTLTRTLDLRNVSSATLQFRLWYDIEADYDYGFVGVSTDGGKTYTSLQGRHTTTEDPQGANWGNGYTGTSGGGDVAENRSISRPTSARKLCCASRLSPTMRSTSLA